MGGRRIVRSVEGQETNQGRTEGKIAWATVWSELTCPCPGTSHDVAQELDRHTESGLFRPHWPSTVSSPIRFCDAGPGKSAHSICCGFRFSSRKFAQQYDYGRRGFPKLIGAHFFHGNNRTSCRSHAPLIQSLDGQEKKMALDPDKSLLSTS